MEPDESTLVDDLQSIRFIEAVDRGYWRLVARDRTLVTFELTARTGRQVGVRLDCGGYPAVAPTGQLWSLTNDEPLPIPAWPTGGRASQVFNPNWSSQFGGAFYYPYDRRALEGHGGWANEHTGHVWTIDTTVVDALYLLREILRTATGPKSRDITAEEAS